MSLTLRAILTGGSQLALTISAMLIGLLITPFLLRTLGSTQYGLWCILLQFASYSSLFDIGHSTVMKLRLASITKEGRTEELRREIGAAAAGLVVSAPVFAVGMIALWYFLPFGGDETQSHVLLGVLLVSLLVQRVTGFFGNVLFGANLEYRGTISRTAITVITSLLDAIVVALGAGLLGLAVNRVFSAMVLLLAHVRIVRRHVPWYGLAFPGPRAFWRSFKENAIYVISHWGSVLTESVEITVVGLFAGPAGAAAYVLTTAPARMVLSTLSRFVTGGHAAIGSLFAEGKYAQVRQIREMAWGLIVAACGIVWSVAVLFNSSFVGLWVAQPNDLGLTTLSGYLAFTTLLLLTRFNGGLWMAALDVTAAARSHFLSAGAGLACSALLTRELGVPGMLIGLSIGRVMFLLHSEHALTRLLGRPVWRSTTFLRPAVFGCLLIVVATSHGAWVSQSWMSLFIRAVVVGASAAVLTWSVGLTSAARRDLRLRFGHVVSHVRSDRVTRAVVPA